MRIKNYLFILLSLFIFKDIFPQVNSSTVNHLIFSEYLSENRLINVSTPINYKNTDKTYPVLYVLDGEYVFNYAKGTVDFLSNSFGYLPDIIIVGVNNIDRNKDLFVSLNSKDGYVNFINFLESELIKFININYRTNGFNILYGWSSGSGICSYMLTTKPYLFDGYIQSGTAIGPKMSDFMKTNILLHNYENKYLYANCEDSGARVPGFKRYSELIESVQPKGLKWKIEIMANTSHVGVLSEGLYKGLNFIFSDFYIPDSLARKGFKEIIECYLNIDNNYNFEVEIPAGAVSESASILLQENNLSDAIQLLSYGMKLYPESSDLPSTLGEIYEFNQDMELAAKYFDIALRKCDHLSANFLKYEALLKKVQNK